MTARPKWWTEKKKKKKGYIFSHFGGMSSIQCFLMFSCPFFFFFFNHTKPQQLDHLPKSIPSDTFPLATESRMAPRPFSQAWNENRRHKHGVSSNYLITITKSNRTLGLSPPGISPEPCWSLQRQAFRWKSACFSGCFPGSPVSKRKVWEPLY